MSPQKPLSLLIDEVIENEIDSWTEQKQRDAEQTIMEFIDEE